MQKVIYRIRYCIVSFLAVIFITAFFPNIAYAEEFETEKGSITVNCNFGGSQVQLYLVGDYNDEGICELNEDYSEYRISLFSPTADQTLESYIVRDKHEPLFTDKTDEKEHKVKFDNLEQGLYLVSGRSIIVDGVIYRVSPALIPLPTSEGMNVEIKMKSTADENPETKNISVLKVWDDNNSSSRPKEISVDLLKDDEIYETVFLTSENNWRYKWTGLDGTSEWRITESKVPVGYTVSIEKTGDNFAVTNTAEKEPAKSDTPNQSTPYTPDSSPKPEQKLLQTGQLRWPIIVFLPSGLLLLIIGMIRRKRSV